MRRARASTPQGALRAVDSMARPRSWRAFGSGRFRGNLSQSATQRGTASRPVMADLVSGFGWTTNLALGTSCIMLVTSSLDSTLLLRRRLGLDSALPIRFAVEANPVDRGVEPAQRLGRVMDRP